MPRTACVLLLVPLLAACDAAGTITIVPEFDLSFSFESGLGTWSAMGTDLMDPPVTWSVDTSTDQASEGARSVRLFLENFNGAGKIWIHRGFDVEPNQAYDVEMMFDFGTSDFGDVNLWRILAGAHTSQPSVAADLVVQDGTGSGSATDSGHQWLEKSYTARATADEDGRIHLVLGVGGTWETPRAYYIDNVRVLFTRAS